MYTLLTTVHVFSKTMLKKILTFLLPIGVPMHVHVHVAEGIHVQYVCVCVCHLIDFLMCHFLHPCHQEQRFCTYTFYCFMHMSCSIVYIVITTVSTVLVSLYMYMYYM